MHASTFLVLCNPNCKGCCCKREKQVDTEGHTAVDIYIIEKNPTNDVALATQPIKKKKVVL